MPCPICVFPFYPFHNHVHLNVDRYALGPYTSPIDNHDLLAVDRELNFRATDNDGKRYGSIEI
jgi:hypothetical protein